MWLLSWLGGWYSTLKIVTAKKRRCINVLKPLGYFKHKNEIIYYYAIEKANHKNCWIMDKFGNWYLKNFSSLKPL